MREILKNALYTLTAAFMLNGAALQNGTAATDTAIPGPTPVPISTATQGKLPPHPLTVSGSRIIDGHGNTLILHGAQIEGLNVVKPSPESIANVQHMNLQTFQVMHDQWNMNAVRLPLSLWLVISEGNAYLSQVENIVHQANQAGLVVILDAHNTQRCGAPFADVDMPTPELVPAWKAVAQAFLNNHHVIFDVFNEPNTRNLIGGNPDTPGVVDWQAWLDGGQIDGHPIVGMQALIDAIRSTGARQIIAVEGLHTGNTFAGIGNFMPQGENLIFEVHPYLGMMAHPNNPPSSVNWDSHFGFLTSEVPVYAGEWALQASPHYWKYVPSNAPIIPTSESPARINAEMDYFDSHGMSWTAFAFQPSKAGLLIQDWNDYAPTTFPAQWNWQTQDSTLGMGEIVKNRLNGVGVVTGR